MTDETKIILAACSILEDLCRGRDCSDCPLDPNEDEYLCAFETMKEKVRDGK